MLAVAPPPYAPWNRTVLPLHLKSTTLHESGCAPGLPPRVLIMRFAQSILRAVQLCRPTCPPGGDTHSSCHTI